MEVYTAAMHGPKRSMLVGLEKQGGSSISIEVICSSWLTVISSCKGCARSGTVRSTQAGLDAEAWGHVQKPRRQSWLIVGLRQRRLAHGSRRVGSSSVRLASGRSRRLQVGHDRRQAPVPHCVTPTERRCARRHAGRTRPGWPATAAPASGLPLSGRRRRRLVAGALAVEGRACAENKVIC